MTDHSSSVQNGSVLVTGGAGYIGSHVVHALHEGGIPVAVVDNMSTGVRAFVPSDIPFLVADVADHKAVKSFITDHNCRQVIHLAGSVSVEESIKNPLKYYRNNTAASMALIEACIESEVERFVFSSSAAVYGNPNEMHVREDMTPRPISPYGRSKLMTEQMLEDVSKSHGIKFAALRYFNVAGADPQGRCGLVTENSTHLIKVLSETALGARDTFIIYGDDYDTPDGTCIRDYIHVSDLAQAHLAAMNYLSEGESSIINLGYGHGYSVREVVDAFEGILGTRLDVMVGPRREGDIVGMIADVTNMRKCLDWIPKHDDLHEIIATSLQWERSRRQAG